MPLCESCQHFDIHCFATDPDGIRAFKLEAVYNSAREGCDFCLLLLTNLKDDIAQLSAKEVDCSWIHMSLYDNFQRPTRDGKGYRYNKLIAKLADCSTIKPELSSKADSGKQYEFSVAADPGKLYFLRKSATKK